ncbi:hypothetical protein ACWD6R_38950 [Streptomyces sp. NPDC005151]
MSLDENPAQVLQLVPHLVKQLVSLELLVPVEVGVADPAQGLLVLVGGAG